MKQFLKLAWRNLWRNRRRTFITLASVFMAVVLAIAIRSIQKGAYGNMTANAVRFSTGYIQVHEKGYWDDRSINHSFVPDTSLQRSLRRDPNISLAVPRLESFALASSGPHTKGVEVIGIDRQLEDRMNGIGSKIIKGRYFQDAQDPGILVGDGLAHYLGLQPGDTLVLLGQGYHGITAAGQYPVRGLFHYPLEALNNELVYLPLARAQSLFGAPGRLTTLSLMLHQPNRLDQTTGALRQSLDSTHEVMEWPAMNKSLVQEIQGDNAGGVIMLGILYLVVAFGVFGTILMMTLERKKEFAVMIAVGMRRTRLTLVILFETILIGCLGILSGAGLLLPILWYLHEHPIALHGTAAQTYQEFGIEPILPASMDPHILINQGLTVLGIALLSSLYPLWYVSRLPIVNTLKQ